jgi:putative transposase
MSRSYKIHNPEGVYFVTMTVVSWIDIFTRQEYRDIVLDSIRYCQKEKGLVVYGWCIMSNHIHLIVRAKHSNLSDIIRDLKKFTAKSLFKTIENSETESRKRWICAIFRKSGEFNHRNEQIQVWQQDNHPIEIFSNDVIEQKLNYIHQNPVKAGIVENAWEYLYSSAKDYSGQKGLLNIELI